MRTLFVHRQGVVEVKITHKVIDVLLVEINTGLSMEEGGRKECKLS